MVVILLGLIAAIGVPSLLRAYRSGQDNQAQVALDTVVTAQSAFAGTYGTFTGLPSDLDLPAGWPTVTRGASDRDSVVSIALGDGGTLVVAAYSPHGDRCFAKQATFSTAGTDVEPISAPGSDACIAAAHVPAGEGVTAAVSQLPG